MLDRTTLSVEEPAASPITTFPLDRLILSGLNVRKTERDADIAALAEDIAARGLKQNLVVTPAHFSTGEGADEGNVDWAYQLEVIAGGRRFQALKLLAADGRIPEDHPVPCMLERRDEARETSLSENLHRVAMNPADEFEAFAAIVEQHGGGKDAVELCAKRFGVTVKHVEGRLRLSALAPEILQALREGKLGLESAKAYAGTTDHKLQLKVFQAREKKSWLTHDARGVRDELRGKTLAVTDARVNFVGLDAYLAAGGRTETEMFMGSDGVERVLDVAKLEQLVRGKAEAALPALAKRDGYKQALFATGVGYSSSWPKAPAGFERAYDYGSPPSKAAKKKSIGIFNLADDGKSLQLAGRYKPAEKRVNGAYKPPTPEEVAAERRTRGIATIAARLAVGTFAGSPFEGRVYWPATNNRWLDPIEQINDTDVLVSVQVKVTTADIEAQQEAAAAKYDAELTEAEAERQRGAAEAATEDGADLDETLESMNDDETGEFDEEEVAAE